MNQITKTYYSLLLWALSELDLDDPQESPQAALDIYHNIAGNELKDRRGEFAMNSVNLNHDMEVLALKLVGIYEFEEEGDSNAIYKEFEAAISI